MDFKNGIFCFALLAAGSLPAAEYHVARGGHDSADGSAGKPFLTIQKAADIAQPGDTITVHEGVYRERVNPPRGGAAEDRRIVYRAAPGEKVVIKGSEPATGWEPVEDNVWKLTLPNAYFGDFNPFNDRVKGAWFSAKQAWHTGAVYLNGHWLKEAARKDLVIRSLASGEAGAEADQLMNIRALAPGYAFGVYGTQYTTNWVDKSEGLQVAMDDEQRHYITGITDGAYIAYNFKFKEESKSIMLMAASPVAGGFVELRKDAVDGTLIGTFDIGLSANWTDFQSTYTSMVPTSGEQTLYCVFKARPVPPVDPSKYIGWWYAEVSDRDTTIWADFKGKNPNDERVEINVRKTVFYPEQEGVNYITVRGFTLEQAGPGWASATSEQFGLIGTHWSKGWVIEDNIIRYSVGTGVTLGKHGDEYNETYDYHGTIRRAGEHGWSDIGYHRVNNNHISHCAKNGIHGSLGGPFSTITGNTIHDITKNHEFGGADTAGIKLLGGVDVLIADNHIYNCERWGGIWLDWMAQGARVTGNLLHDNSQDLFLEVNHGPHLIDNNLMLSGTYATDASGGGAFVHNLWFDNINIFSDQSTRKTPYFRPHSVAVAGSTDINQDDDRYYNNIFIGPRGIAAYDEHSFSLAAAGNVFLAGAKPSKLDLNPFVDAANPVVKLEQTSDGWWLAFSLPSLPGERPLVTSKLLGNAAVPEAPFESRDGTPYRIDTDYFGSKRPASNPTPGPFQGLAERNTRLQIWPK